MCEKPVTIDPAEAWDLVETAKRLDRELIISFGWNYLPMMKQAKRLMEDVGIGEARAPDDPHAVRHARAARRTPAPIPDADARGGARAGDLDRPERCPAAATARRSSATRSASRCGWPTRASSRPSRWSARARSRTPRSSCTTRSTLRYEGGAIGTMSGASCHLGAVRQQARPRDAGHGHRGPGRGRPGARLDLALPAGRHRPAARTCRTTPGSTTASGRSTRSSTPAWAGWSATGRRASSARARSRCSTCCTAARAAGSSRPAS